MMGRTFVMIGLAAWLGFAQGACSTKSASAPLKPPGASCQASNECAAAGSTCVGGFCTTLCNDLGNLASRDCTGPAALGPACLDYYAGAGAGQHVCCAAAGCPNSSASAVSSTPELVTTFDSYAITDLIHHGSVVALEAMRQGAPNWGDDYKVMFYRDPVASHSSWPLYFHEGWIVNLSNYSNPEELGKLFMNDDFIGAMHIFVGGGARMDWISIGAPRPPRPYDEPMSQTQVQVGDRIVAVDLATDPTAPPIKLSYKRFPLATTPLPAQGGPLVLPSDCNQRQQVFVSGTNTTLVMAMQCGASSSAFVWTNDATDPQRYDLPAVPVAISSDGKRLITANAVVTLPAAGGAPLTTPCDCSKFSVNGYGNILAIADSDDRSAVGTTATAADGGVTYTSIVRLDFDTGTITKLTDAQSNFDVGMSYGVGLPILVNGVVFWAVNAHELNGPQGNASSKLYAIAAR